MSVVIRMQMPEGCEECPFFSKMPRYGQSEPIYQPCKLGAREIPSTELLQKRALDCPIIAELPEEHGRLIDIEYVKDKKFRPDQMNQYNRWWNGALDSIIDNAPTALEAEVTEDDSGE